MTKKNKRKTKWNVCGECNVMFNAGNRLSLTRNDGKKVCETCLRNRVRKAITELEEIE